MPKHEWELRSISKGWGRQNPRTCDQTPVAITEPGLSPSKPGLGWGLHFMNSYTSCSSPSRCSAPLHMWLDMKKCKENSKGEHVRPSLNQQCFDTRMAGQNAESHSTWCTTSCLCHNLSVVAIITLFLTVLLPRECAQLMYISGLYKDILDSHEF